MTNKHDLANVHAAMMHAKNEYNVYKKALYASIAQNGHQDNPHISYFASLMRSAKHDYQYCQTLHNEMEKGTNS